MFILTKSRISESWDTYELIGTYDKLEEAKHAMWEASDDSLNSDLGYDAREVDSSELTCVVFNEDSHRIRCDCFVIFDSDRPVTFWF